MLEEKKGWRNKNPHVLPPGRIGELYPPTMIFDQMYFIGTTKYACYVIKTDEGLVMIDCLTTLPMFLPYIEMCFEQLGLNIKDLRSILITHGHGDHYGNCDVLREKYGTKIFMSEEDYIFAKNANDPKYIFPDGPLRFNPDGFIKDGIDFIQGNMKIYVRATPGHTPGCMSFIIPVTDEGKPHKIAIWGGTGVPGDKQAQQNYLNSINNFKKTCCELGVDGEVSNHPFVDLTTYKLDIVRNIVDGVPNPFIVGQENLQYQLDMFKNMCLEKMKASEET